MSTLPPLPAPTVENFPSGKRSYHETQMLSFGKACAEAAMIAEREACAALIEQRFAYFGFERIAAAIRNTGSKT